MRPMRRFRQELTAEECVQILKRGTHGVLAVLGDEGYLMFTLPVTPAQHITAKLAVGTVWTLLSLALAVLAAAALIFSIPGAAENGMTLARFSAAFRAEMGTGLWMPAAVMLVLLLSVQ